MTMYPPETLDEEDDDGTMPENVAKFAATVVGHRIVSAERTEGERPLFADDGDRDGNSITITLDDGRTVQLTATSDCCAYTELENFLLHADRIDHIITGVGTTDGYTTWHVFADFGDVMEMRVGWSCGNPFYYGYGFDIRVIPGGAA